MTLALLYSALLITIIFYFYRWIKKYFALRKVLLNIPGPKTVPFIGLEWEIKKIPHEDRLTWLTDLNFKYKDGIVLTWLGTKPFISIRKPRQIEVILPSNILIEKGLAYVHLQPWLGEGLLTSSGDTWHSHRRLITPAFHFGILEEYSAVMSEKVQIFCECIEAKMRENPERKINIFELATNYALDTICESAMGVNIDTQRNCSNSYADTLVKMTQLLAERFVNPWYQSDFIYYNTKNGKKFLNCVKVIHDFTRKVIEQKKEERAQSKSRNEENVDEFGSRKRKAFLDLLLNASESHENPLTMREMQEEVDTFMFADYRYSQGLTLSKGKKEADVHISNGQRIINICYSGYDTTSATISWTLFLLGNNPNIQKKVHEELKEVFGDDEEIATTNQLGKLKYLDRVIKEALRLFPAAGRISRCLETDVTIDGYFIPKGTNVSIQIYMLHRDPDVWEDPETFDPDRFLPENTTKRHAYAYIPFSAGPRNCIGQKFALLELKTALTAVLRKWRVRSALKPSEIKVLLNIILRPHGEKIELYLTPIKKF